MARRRRTPPSPAPPDRLWFKSNENNPSGGGHYIAGNTIIGGWDGIGGEEEGSAHGTFHRNTIVENNTIQDTWDDCIQSEGGDQNVRIRSNDLSGCGPGREDDAIPQTNENLTPILSRRNVFHVSRYVFTLGYPSVPAGMDFDEDCIWSTNENIIKWGSDYYTRRASFQAATGQEENGREGQDCSSPEPSSPTPTRTPTRTPTPTPTRTASRTPTLPPHPT